MAVTLTRSPDNTQCIAAIEEAKWADYQGESYINLKWRVMRPAEYANRVLFQKLKFLSMATKATRQNDAYGD